MALTTGSDGQAWAPNVQAFMPSDVIPEALILRATTVAGQIAGDEPTLMVPWVLDDSAEFTDEGDEIDEADPTLSEAVVGTRKVAQLLRVSREQYNQNRAADLLSESVRRAVTKKANEAFLTDSDSGHPGLLETDGMTTGDDIDSDLDPLASMLADLADAGADPGLIIAAPSSIGRLRRMKRAAESNEALLGAGADDMEMRLFGIEVAQSPAMPSGQMLIVDKSDIPSATGEVQLAVSEDAYFASDSVGVRCTFRFGHTVMHAERIGKLKVSDPDA